MRVQGCYTNNAKAREVVIIITGAHKSLALQRCIEGGVNHMWTLSSLQLHPHAMIVVDEDATLELQVKTVKVGIHNHIPLNMANSVRQYFKSIEQVATSQGFGQSLPSEQTILQKRDSVRIKLDSPRSPTSKSFLAGPKPELTRQITHEPQTSEPENLSAPRPELSRQITPEPVLDSMHTRLPRDQKPGLEGLEIKELPIKAMHERVDSATA